MNPTISNISETGDIYKVTIQNINVSLANAIRRTILSDIPTLAFYTETYNDNQCNIMVNTTRLHNEILKHRLSCIPIHEKDFTILPESYILDLDMKNETDNMIIVTTEHFRIRNKTNGNFLSKDETRRIFPANQKTQSFIDFARIRPKISDTIPGEQIKLTCEFSVRCAKDNSMFNVVSKCSYGNTPDMKRIDEVWEEQSNKLASEKLSADEIEFEKKNFYLLDAQRHFVPDSFDFVLQTLGVFENREIIQKACKILHDKLINLMQLIDSDGVPINNSETTMDFCFDIVLENEDYTIGKVLEYILYEKYYLNEKIFTYCGFKKFHPHNDDSVIRIAYLKNADKRMVAQHLRFACIDAGNVFKKLYEMFGK
uniref:DNA-directed RNA polymerase RpoA/D/Rpb3-type domain-containing protein n=1 Tax=viral metagenome TaxID=1070528 RepID=A0A6C0JJ11_9ZZZZ